MAETNKIKKTIKIFLICLGILIILYIIFIVLMFYTPLWKYLPSGMRKEVVKLKMEGDEQFIEVMKNLGQNEDLSEAEIARFYQIAADKSQSSPTRAQALNKLRLAGVSTSEVVALEKKIAADPQADADLKYIALKALGQTAAGDYTVLLAAIERESGPAGIIAAQSLARQAGPEIIPQLLAIAVDESKSLSARENAIVSLEDMFLQDKVNNQQVIETVAKIKPLLQHEKYAIRTSSSSLLNNLTGKKYEIEGPTEAESQTFFFGE